MSTILLEEEIRSYIRGTEIKSSMPYSHYVTILNQRIDDQCHKIKTQFLASLESYHKMLENNPIIGSETNVIKLPEDLYGIKYHPNIWSVLIYISSIIAEENGLLGEKTRTMPIQILQESRNKINIDYSKSMGLFIDLAPLLIDLDHVKANTSSIAAHIHELDELKRKNNINWLNLFADVDKLGSVLIINYLGLYDINFDTIKKMMIEDFNGAVSEITIALYGHNLIIKYPVFKKQSGRIGEVLQEKIKLLNMS